MRISNLILRTSDLDRSVDFWTESVGLSLTARAGAFAFIDGGSLTLTLNQIDREVSDPSLTEIVLEVEDVRSDYQALKENGVPFEVELRPVTTDGDRTLVAAHFHDPDGHLASITGWVIG